VSAAEVMGPASGDISGPPDHHVLPQHHVGLWETLPEPNYRR
jgi:hypothetical protein